MPGANLNHFSHELVKIMPLMFREFAKRESNVLTSGQISFPQMVALDFVSRKPRVTMTDLAKILHIRTSSTTVLVDRLIKQGMLKRGRDEKDRRLVWVSVTPKGRKVLTQIMREKRQSVKRIFGILAEEERRQYLGILRKIKSHLTKGHGV